MKYNSQNYLAAILLFIAFATSAAKPNIVVILADDMPRHHPGFNGGPVQLQTSTVSLVKEHD
jgi:hypothetical protein